MPKSILNGVIDIIDKALGLKRIGEKSVGKAPHYQHRTNCLRLSKGPVTAFNVEALIDDVYEKVKSNLIASRSPSKENWRWKPNWAKTEETKAEKRRKKLEVKLERMIIETSDDWINQVPTASGLVNKHSDKRRSIDLVHRCGDRSYEFLELKVKSDNPLYAAMEILQYGILYILARTNEQVENTGKKKELLKAKAVHLKVLAPTNYYEGLKLDWLERGINDGLKRFLTAKESSFLMDFKFEAFPPYFSLSPFLNLEAIKEALEDRRSVYP